MSAAFSTFTFPSSAGAGFINRSGNTTPIAGWGSITPPVVPVVTNATGESDVTSSSARLNGEITDTGSEDPVVHIYWGDNDGGTVSSDWDNDINLGTKGAEAFYTDISGLNANTTYYYRCYAVNSSGGSWASNAEIFSTLSSSLPPEAPILLSTGTTIVFKWNTSSGATKYWLQVNTAETFDGTSIYDSELGNVTSQEVTGFSAGTPYYWRVRAGNNNAWSDWSSVKSVTGQ